MRGLQTQEESIASDISVQDNPPAQDQATSSDSDEETVVVIPDEQAKSDSVPLEAAEMIKPSMKPKTQKRITELVKKGHENARTIEEKDQKIKDLEDRIGRVESKATERETQETRVRAEATLAHLQTQRKEAYEEQDWDKINALDLQINQAAGNINNAAQAGFDSKKYFATNNDWYGTDQKKTKVAERINDEIWNDAKFSHFTAQQKLDEVARQTNALFSSNPHSSFSPTDGAPISKPSKKTIYLKESDYAYLKQAYPTKSEKELLELGRKLISGIQS